MKTKSIGKIFDIQRFALNDGPGIRTTVFLKGCTLECAWCHNPESWNPKSELGFIESRCLLCRNCETVCEYDVHSFSNAKHSIDRNKCVLCGKCVEVCSENALKIYGIDYTTEELLSLLVKDEIYYNESGGGVTVSGGEPLQQSKFVKELFSALKNRNIHTCLDTSGYSSSWQLDELIHVTDLFLFDYKLSSINSYCKYTNIELKRVLENLNTLNTKKKDIILRCTIIPEINDNAYHIKKIVELVNTYKNIIQVDILPFHQLGISKYSYVGKGRKAIVLTPSNLNVLNNIKDVIQKETEIPIRIANS